MKYRMCPRGCGKKLKIKNERNEINIIQTHYKTDCTKPSELDPSVKFSRKR